MRKLSETDPVVLFQCKAEHNFPVMFVSKNVRELTGYAAEDYIRNEALWSSRIHEEDRNIISGDQKDTIYKSGYYTRKYRFKQKNGHYIWLKDDLELIKDQNGQPAYIIGSAVKVTGKNGIHPMPTGAVGSGKTNWIPTGADKSELRILLEAVSRIDEFVLITKKSPGSDGEPKIIYANEAFKRKWGYKNEDLIGNTPSVFWGEETDHSVVKWIGDEMKAGRKISGVEMIKYDNYGNKIWVKLSITPYINREGHDKQFMVTFSDITERKHNEMLIEGQLKILEMILSGISLNEILMNIARFVESLSSDFKCAILLTKKEASGDRLVLGAAPNLSEKYKLGKDGLVIAPDAATSGTAAFRKEKVLINDIRNSPLWKNYIGKLRDTELQASWAAPIFSSTKEVLGTVTLYFNKLNKKQEYNEKLIEIAAYLAGIAIERKRERQVLVESETKFKALFDSAIDGIAIMKDDQILECNESFLKMFSASKEEISNKSFVDLSTKYQGKHELSSVKAHHLIQEALSGSPCHFEWKNVVKNGETIDTYISMNRIMLDNQYYLQAIFRDITEQKKAQAEIIRNTELFIQLFNNSPAGIVIVDLENKIQMTNEAFRKTFGYSKAELMGEDIDSLIIPDDYQLEGVMLSKVIRSGETFQIETVRKHKNGKLIPVVLDGVSVVIENKTIATFGIYIDISERYENEKKIRAALKEKETLLAEIHHRVKNNLAVISGLLELQLGSSEDPTVKEVLQESQTRIQSIALIHEKLYHSETLSNIAFDEYVRDLVKTIQHTYDKTSCKISFDILTDRVFLNITQAIPSALIVNELIVNIYKHAFHGYSSGNVQVELQKEQNYINLRVKDNGCGLPDDFNFKKPRSLGMKLIQTLARQLDGKPKFSVDNGTLFTLRFKSESN